MILDAAQYIALMAACFLLIILLVRLLFYVRKQAEEVRKLDRRLKLMENLEKKEDVNNG